QIVDAARAQIGILASLEEALPEQTAIPFVERILLEVCRVNDRDRRPDADTETIDPADTLNERTDAARLGYQMTEIKVRADLERLGGYDHQRPPERNDNACGNPLIRIHQPVPNR